MICTAVNARSTDENASVNRAAGDVAGKLPLCLGRDVLVESQIVAALVGETIGNHSQRRGLAGAGVGFDLQIIATGHCIEHGRLLGRGVESCEHGKSRRALMLPAYGPRSEE